MARPSLDEIFGATAAPVAAATRPSLDEIFQASPEPQKPAEAPRIPEGTGGAETVARGLLPRSFKAAEEGAGVLRQAGAGALDALSAPGRIADSLNAKDTKSKMQPVGFGGMMIPVQPDAVKGRAAPDRGLYEAMADTQGKSLPSKIIRDPALLPSLALGGPAAKLATKGLAAGAKALGMGAKAAPVVAQGAGRLATAGRIAKGIGATASKAAIHAGTTGAIEGAASAAIHQADRAAQGQEVDLGDAATEVALSAVLPAVVAGGFSVAKEAGKEAAKGIMQTALKPNKSLLQGRGSKLDMQQIFDMNLDSPRGLEAMDDKIKAFRENVKANYGELLKQHQGKKFNIRGALSQAIQEAEGEMANFKNADQVEGLKKGIQYWKDYLANTSLNLNNGWMPIEDVASLRAGVWGAAKFNQASPAGYAEFAEKFGHKINEQLGNRLPEARKLDALLSKTRPMEQASEDAIRRVGNNRYVSLTDAIGGTAAIAGALASGDPENAKWGLGLALGARALRSPGASSVLYRSANKLPQLAATAPAQRVSRRIIGGLMREEEKERGEQRR